MFDPLSDLFARDEFRTGLAFGAAAAAVVAVLALASRRSLPWAGLAFGAAAVLALRDRFAVPDEVVVGLVLLVVGGALTGRCGWVLRLLAAVPGAVVLAAGTDLDTPLWGFDVIAVVTVVGGVAAGDLDRTFRDRGVGPVLLPVTMLGAYLTTPDTEHTSLLLGAALPLVLLGWPRPLASLGVGGAQVATALLAWNVIVDGTGRDGAVVGGIACLGMFVVEPAVRAATARRLGPPGTTLLDAAVVAVLHVVVVAACSRVAGLRDAAGEAAVLVAVIYALAAAALLAVRARGPRRTGDPVAA